MINRLSIWISLAHRDVRKFLFVSSFTLNHRRSDDLDALIVRCIDLINNCPNTVVTISQYHIYIKTSSCEIDLWNENRFHGWLNRGSVNGRRFERLGASKSLMFDLKECLEAHGYDIYTQEERNLSIIRIDDVKC